jgi:hypothetical protein
VNKHLLWVDCIAAALGGGAVLLLGPWLPSLYGLPAGLLVFIGLANLAYGSYSFSPALLRRRPPVLITLLVAANGAWVLDCLGMALHFAGSATWLGLGHLVVEAVFVGSLAAREWKWRVQLAR